MSSPAIGPDALAPEIKEEDSIVADNGAPDAVEDGPAPSTLPEAGLTKKEYDMMTGILHRISNYRDEEYALYRGPIYILSMLMNC
jgi:chromatin structure-remodeling complex subunit RSC1/2